jgi:ligand-binding sensor domain-containing protein
MGIFLSSRHFRQLKLFVDWRIFAEGISIYHGHKWSKLNLNEDIHFNWGANITPDNNNNIWITTGEGVYVLQE